VDAGFFHTMFKVTAQTSGNQDAMALPAFVGFNTTYAEFQLVKNVLWTQLGFDVFYNTPYYAKAYMPATGMFYAQEEKKIGNSPYSDVFLNIRLKRTRFSIKYENLTGVFNPRSGYFIPHYPYNPRILKFGVSWTFYD
ncbi:MAG TPA: putative porin, partial [Bacteroidales bacterium]|nr:putative porin [Bacteroidales bacterium]